MRQEPRSPFSPLRLIDLIIENWWKIALSIFTLIFALFVAQPVYDATGSALAWLATLLFVLAAESAIVPRWTIYDRPIGIRWNGWLYRRIRSRMD